MLAFEGLWYIIIPAFLFVAFVIAGVWRKRPGLFVLAGFFLVVWLFMMYFYRDPARPKPRETAIVSPTDGVIDGIEQLPGGRTRLHIYLSLWDVHAIRSPATGLVRAREFTPGEFLTAGDPDSRTRNQRIDCTLDTHRGRVHYAVISGAVARRVLMPVDAGDSLLAGQRIGFIRFGSRSMVTLPAGVETALAVGDRVVGGVTVLAEANPAPPATPGQDASARTSGRGAQ